MSLWVLVLIWAVAAVFVAYAIRGRRESRQFAAGAARAQGVVVELVGGPAPGPQTPGMLSYPVVRYRATDGQEVVFRSNFGARPSPWRPGQPVTVLYNPANPQEARIETSARSTGLPALFVVLAVGMAGIASVVVLFIWWAQSLVDK
jgi:hypothetical protein